MKTKTNMSNVLLAGLLLLGAVQAEAVDFKNTYRAEYGTQSMEYRAPATVAAPAATFQSTNTMTGSGSAYSATPSLNEDGTAAYEGASYESAETASHPGHIRKVGGGQTIEGTPIGEGLWVLATLACAYLIVRVARRKKRTPAKDISYGF